MKTAAGWNKPPIATHFDGNSVHISCVFSWDAVEAVSLARYFESVGRDPRIGGPAVRLNPDWFGEYADTSDHPMLLHHNARATLTSRGCPRRCAFCAVPTIEGELVELDDWTPKPLVCDNNLLACSPTHFNRVIDRLKQVGGVDFNQGLDARLLTAHHADRIAEIDIERVRLAWDHSALEMQFHDAWEKLRKAGIPKAKISVYVLIGFNDDPADALYRLSAIKNLGAMPNPMRYQPLDSRRRNEYVHHDWQAWELTAYMRYWSNLRFTAGVPFSEWLETYRREPILQEKLL